MQGTATLSVTEAETVSLIEIIQDMLYVKDLLESIELKVKLPMIVECDNKGVIDLVNGWTVVGRTRHLCVKLSWLRDLKMKGIVLVKHIPGVDNPAVWIHAAVHQVGTRARHGLHDHVIPLWPARVACKSNAGGRQCHHLLNYDGHAACRHIQFKFAAIEKCRIRPK